MLERLVGHVEPVEKSGLEKNVVHDHRSTGCAWPRWHWRDLARLLLFQNQQPVAGCSLGGTGGRPTIQVFNPGPPSPAD